MPENRKNKIRFFNSVQEQEEEMIEYWASITPIERLQHLHEMIIHSFGLTKEQLKAPNKGRSIKVISYRS